MHAWLSRNEHEEMKILGIFFLSLALSLSLSLSLSFFLITYISKKKERKALKALNVFNSIKSLSLIKRSRAHALVTTSRAIKSRLAAWNSTSRTSCLKRFLHFSLVSSLLAPQ